MAKKKKKQTSVRKLVVSLVIGVVAVTFVGAFAYQYAARTGGNAKSVAVVNGQPISISSESLFANLYRQYYEEERNKSKEGEITKEKDLELLRRALDTVIQRTLILQYAKRHGITVDRETVLTSIVQKGYYRSQGKNYDEERYRQTPESERQRIFQSEKEQLIINLFYNEYFGSVPVTNLEAKSFYQFMDYGKKIEFIYLRLDDIPEKTLKSFYDENPKLFEQAHVAIILIKGDEQRAEKALDEVRQNPDNFAEIAKQYSEDTTKEKGGDLGWFYRSDMTPEFSEVAFGLKKGQISGVVKTPFGYEIIKALDNVKVEPFQDALFRVKREYVDEHRDELEKKVASLGRDLLTAANANPAEFRTIAKDLDVKITTTDFITLSGQYILNEEKNLPLFELMNVPELTNLVYSTPVGKIGGPVSTQEGEIIFKVIGEKQFDSSEYEKAKDYVVKGYGNLKENALFNDWYVHEIRKAKITDNFNEFFKKQG
jgi:parvulin-like peptidyl-prolyl isomerase